MSIQTQPFLGVRVRGASGSPQLATITGATTTPIGSTFGSLEETVATNDAPQTRAVRFRGQLFAMVNGTLYATSATSPGTPSQVHAPAHTLPTANAAFGPMVIVNPTSGVPTLYYFYNTQSPNNFLYAVTSTDGLTFAETGMTNPAFDTNGIAINSFGFYHNQIHFIGYTDDWYIDLPSMTIGKTTGTNGGLSGNWWDYCTLQGALYRVGYSTNALTAIVQVLVGTNWSPFTTIPAPNSGNWASFTNIESTMIPRLFAPGDGFMYAIYGLQAQSLGWACGKITSAGVATDISATVLPTSLAPLSINNISGNSRVFVAQEMESTPGTLSTHLWFNNTGLNLGASMSYWFWNTGSSVIGNSGAPNDNGVIGDWAIPSCKFNGPDSGGYIYAQGSPEIYFEQIPGQAQNAAFESVTLVGPTTTTTGIQSLPTSNINVMSTTNFPTSGTLIIITDAGPQVVTYTGTMSGNIFTGCLGGAGNTSNGGSVVEAKSFQIYGTTTGEFESANSSPLTLAAPTLFSGTGNTPMLNINGTQVDNCSADGTSVYQFKTTGLTNGARYNLVPRVF